MIKVKNLILMLFRRDTSFEFKILQEISIKINLRSAVNLLLQSVDFAPRAFFSKF